MNKAAVRPIVEQSILIIGVISLTTYSIFNFEDVFDTAVVGLVLIFSFGRLSRYATDSSASRASKYHLMIVLMVLTYSIISAYAIAYKHCGIHINTTGL